MSDDTEVLRKVRYSISSDGITNNKPQVNSNDTYYCELENNQTNFYEILSWCKKLKIFKPKFITDIECNRKMKVGDKFQLILNTIEKNVNSLPTEKLKVFENIVKNVLLLDDPNLNEYTEELPEYGHLDKFDVQKTNHPTINKSAVPVYPMCGKNRGVLFFVNIINFPLDEKQIRRGAEYDKMYMIHLFREYGYTIYYYEDLLANTFWKLVDRLINKYLDHTESLVFALASHGSISNDVQFYYDQTINGDDIVYKFNNLNCSAMYGKPKIFLFPFCRGNANDLGHYIQTDGGSIIKPTFSDLLICYASIHGYATIRDDNFGTWYIEAFCKVLAQNGHTHDIEEMLLLVGKEIQQMTVNCNKKRREISQQGIFLTPSFVRRDFNKLLFFNPGFAE